ncbi:hypothetical protein AMJ85_09165 [candidate division BRC1 bacterium SM23_51]|nr:MAG: hypothetical protein AMJ85_09165 [candidate division BRC1 bacterium SM23_51]
MDIGAPNRGERDNRARSVKNRPESLSRYERSAAPFADGPVGILANRTTVAVLVRLIRRKTTPDTGAVGVSKETPDGTWPPGVSRR